jgi:hypothetical protein
MLVGVVVSLAAPGVLLAASRAGDGGSGKLTLAGRVGPLQLDRSTEGRVIAFAGRPAATGTGNFSAYPPDPDYFAMGYDCQEHSSGWLFTVDRYGYCRTVFYINTHNQLLAAFATSSPRYSFRGARPGMPTRTANQRLHRRAQGGCFSGYFFGFHSAASFVGDVFSRRSYEHDHHIYLVGGRLKALELESHRYPVGLLFC